MTGPPTAAPDLDRHIIAAEPDPAAPVVLARAQWPDGPDDTLTPIAGFIVSSYSPLVAEVAERCLRARHGRPPSDPELGGRTGVVLASVHGDVGTAEAIADAVRTGRRVQPLLFFQSNPNAVIGHLTARWGLAGPVVCTSPTGADPLEDALAVAALMLDSGDAAEVLVIVADQGAEEVGAERDGTAGSTAGVGAGVGADQAVALVVGPRVGLPALPLPVQPGPQKTRPARHRPAPRGKSMSVSSVRARAGTSVRAQLAADPDLGAGNVLTTLVARDIGLDNPALTFDTAVGTHPAWQPLTVRELDRLVRARAADLAALGVRRRDPVAVTATAAADLILSFLALARLGAIPALLNAKVPPELAATWLRRVRPAGIIGDAARLAELDGHDLGAPVLTDVAKLGLADPEAAPDPYRHYQDDPVAITHSSGTTGVPKAVVHSHRSLFAALKHRLTLPRSRGTERILSAFPVPHAAGLIVLNQALSQQGELLMLSHQTGPTILDAIEKWRPAGVFGFATTWADLAHFDLASRDLDSVTLWANTGDCAHEAHIRRLIAHGHRMVATPQGPQRVPGSMFIDALGSSEMGHSHFFITHTPQTNRYNRCIGRPHAWADVKVLDPDDNELPPGQIGELATKAPTLALGYWNDSVTTFRTRVRGYFLTGDLGYRDEDGYFYQVDRLVDSVDLGAGRRLFTALSEERVLVACPDVVDCTVVAVRDGDQVVTDLLLELEAGADPDADRTGAVRGALGPDVAPTLRRVVVVGDGDIPFGPTGKVRKFALRERYLKTLGAR